MKNKQIKPSDEINLIELFEVIGNEKTKIAIIALIIF